MVEHLVFGWVLEHLPSEVDEIIGREEAYDEPVLFVLLDALAGGDVSV